MTDKISLRLFITGRTLRSERAVANLQRLCEEQLGERCDLHIVDVLEQPQLAEKERIIATPTLIREWPPPSRRVIGDLSNTEQVLLGLGLKFDLLKTSTEGATQ